MHDNQLTGFQMIGTSPLNVLIIVSISCHSDGGWGGLAWAISAGVCNEGGRCELPHSFHFQPPDGSGGDTFV